MRTDIDIRDDNNRRQKSRFPIRRELRFRLLQEGKVSETGQAETLNMSSGGVAFAFDRDLPIGAFIELSISWPVQLETGTHMRLVVFGRVLRSADNHSACSVDKYEFRTQARPIPTTAGKVDSMPRRWGNGLPSREPLKGGLLNFASLGFR